MKRAIKEYLTFTKKERLAVIILLVLITTFLILPDLLPPHLPDVVENEALHRLMTHQQSGAIDGNSTELPDKSDDDAAVKPKPRLFVFDPNTITLEDWLSLGLKERTAQTIIRYRNKGGTFRTPADLGKIWGLRKEDVERLTPYVHIATSGQQNMDKNRRTEPAKPRIIDINTAGETDWAQLPGIGKMLAVRIVRFRDKMNGFVRVEQVAKTYGLSDSQYQSALPYLQCSAETARKIDINTTTAYELISACGLPADIAYAIVRERKKRGSFKSMEDFKTSIQLSETQYKQLEMILTIREP